MPRPGWEFVAAIPGISIRGPVEAHGVAIVSTEDDRYASGELEERARIGRYLSRFRTIGGARVNSVLIIRNKTASAIARDDLTFLRNSFALSAVLLARAHACRGQRYMGGPSFSDAFDFPTAWLRRGPGLVIETPGLLSLGSTSEKFCGHPSAAYPYGQSDPVEWDQPLLDALMSVWRAPKRGPHAVFRRRIMRVLEIAYTALRAPAYNLRSGNDWGVSLALWISAFETMANVPRWTPQIRPPVDGSNPATTAG